MAQNKEKNPGSEFIHSANMRRTSEETRSSVKLLGRDNAQLPKEVFERPWLAMVHKMDNSI